MKKLPCPNDSTAITSLDGIISRKKKKEYITSLKTNRNYIVQRYSEYKKNQNKLEEISESHIKYDLDKEALHSSFNSSFKINIKKNELEKIYKACRGVCPYCGYGKTEEIDHYIPKENFPEYTLLPTNLIPLCNKCNKKKGEKFLDSNKKRDFINFYYDDIDKYQFLDIIFTYDSSDLKNSINIEYNVDYNRIPNIYLKKIIEHHFYFLDLLDTYANAANDEIEELVNTICNQSNNDKNAIKTTLLMTIEGKKNSRLKEEGNNDWKYLLYNELFNKKFIDDLVQYVENII